MASKYLQKFPVPHGFQEILADLTRQILREQPPNIVEFAALYFEGLQKGRKTQGSSTHRIDGVSAKNEEEMTRRASNIAGNIEEKQ